MLKLVNTLEYLVLEKIDDLLQRDETICRCERCRLDIAAIALNSLPPSYVVTVEGEVLKQINRQLKVDVLGAVSKAIEKVKENPHHEKTIRKE